MSDRPPSRPPRPSAVPPPVDLDAEIKLARARRGDLEREDVTGVINLALEKLETAAERVAQSRKRGLRDSEQALKILLDVEEREADADTQPQGDDK